LALGEGDQRVSKSDRVEAMLLSRLHEFDERPVKPAPAQSDEYAFGGVENPRAGPACLRGPTVLVHRFSPSSHPDRR
jgi:hypothetical protein